MSANLLAFPSVLAGFDMRAPPLTSSLTLGAYQEYSILETLSKMVSISKKCWLKLVQRTSQSTQVMQDQLNRIDSCWSHVECIVSVHCCPTMFLLIFVRSVIESEITSLVSHSIEYIFICIEVRQLSKAHIHPYGHIQQYFMFIVFILNTLSNALQLINLNQEQLFCNIAPEFITY